MILMAKKERFSDMEEMKEFLDYIGYTDLSYLDPSLVSCKVRHELLNLMIEDESTDLSDLKMHYKELMEKHHPNDAPNFHNGMYVSPDLLDNAFKHFKEKR